MCIFNAKIRKSIQIFHYRHRIFLPLYGHLSMNKENNSGYIFHCFTTIGFLSKFLIFEIVPQFGVNISYSKISLVVVNWNSL